MTDCERAAELISAQLDGELTPAETALLEAHLEQCPSCRALQKDFQALHQVLLEAASQWTAEPPADLTQRVLERVREAAAVPFRAQKSRWRRWAPLAAVLTLVVIGGGMFAWGGGASGGAPAGNAAEDGSAAGIMLASLPQESGGPQADGAAASGGGEAVPESAPLPEPDAGAKESGVTAYSGEGGEPATAAQSPQSRAADGPEGPDVLPANALGACSTSGEDPGGTEQNVGGYTVYDVPMTITINGNLFCETGEGLDAADGTNGAELTLPKGYEPLGQLTSDTEVSSQDGLQLYANFSATGTVYANAEEPDRIYVWMDAEWFSGIARFDLVPTDGE